MSSDDQVLVQPPPPSGAPPVADGTGAATVAGGAGAAAVAGATAGARTQSRSRSRSRPRREASRDATQPSAEARRAWAQVAAIRAAVANVPRGESRAEALFRVIRVLCDYSHAFPGPMGIRIQVYSDVDGAESDESLPEEEDEFFMINGRLHAAIAQTKRTGLKGS